MTWRAAVCLVAVALLAGVAQAHPDEAGVTGGVTLTDRTAIVVEGDAGFTAANGVVAGTGSLADPFLITGWRVPSLTVANTTAAVRVDDVAVDGPLSLRAAAGAVVQHVDAERILVEASPDVAVRLARVTASSGDGVRVVASPRVLLEESAVTGHVGSGVSLAGSPDATVKTNLIRDNGVGITIEAATPDALVWDNLFANTENAASADGSERWNLSKRVGPNVVGGPHRAGNYWSDAPSDLHDHDGDGIAESHGPYTTGLTRGGDYLPLWDAPGSPEAGFTATPESPDTDEVVNFIDASADGAHLIVNWTWSIDEVVIGYGPSFARSFTEPVDVLVELRVRDAYGLVDTATRRISVRNQKPVVAFTHEASRIVTDPVVPFDASPSHDPDGTVTSWTWTFGDGSSAQGATVTHTFGEDGAYAVAVRVVDDRLGAAHRSLLVVLDRAAPFTVAAVGGTAGHAGWFTSQAALTLHAVDGLSGVAATEYRLGDGAWLPYTGAVSLGHGVHDVTYRSRDAAGNVETVQSVTVRVDEHPPLAVVTAPEFLGPQQGAFVSATDDGSGVAAVWWQVDGEAWWTAGPGAAAVLPRPDGPLSLVAFAEDAAGNAGPNAYAASFYDGTGPAVTIQAPAAFGLSVPGARAPLTVPKGPLDDVPLAPVAVGEVFVDALAADSASGVHRMTLTIEGAVVADVMSDRLQAAWRVTPGTARAVTVTITAVDVVGNSATAERVVYAIPLPGAVP